MMDIRRSFGLVSAVLLFYFIGIPLVVTFSDPARDTGKISQFDLVSYHKNGSKQWEIQGQSADIFADNVHLDSIYATAYGDERSITLSADKGEFDKKNNNVKLKKNVVATTSDGAQLTTDELDWLSKEEKIVTDKKVFITNENVDTEAIGAEGYKSLESVMLKEEVTVRVKKPAMIITCDGPLSIDYPKNIAVFENNVKVTDERGKLYANKMEVHFNSKTNEIERVIAIKNVIITQGDNVSYCEKAIYLAKEQRVILEGNPRLEVLPQDSELDSMFFGKTKESENTE